MTGLYEILGVPFGFVLRFIYDTIGMSNYAIAIILLTLLARILMIPSSIGQQKGMVKTQRMQAKIRKIQTKYAGNQQKMNEAMNELYAREGYSSMTGGCSGLLIQLPIMMGVYYVNYKLLSYVLRIPEDVMEKIKAATRTLEAFKGSKNGEYEIEMIALRNFDQIKDVVPVEYVEKIEEFIGKLNIFGMNLLDKPETSLPISNPLWLIPILTGVTAFAMSIYTWLRQKKTNPEMAKNPSMGCMSFTTPLMSIWFSFMFSASVGVYIIMSTILSMIQMVIMNKVFSPKKVLAKTMVDETINRRAKEKMLKKIANDKNEN
jgi:YidC/Oxa1 family membrane protein insertase